MPIKEAWVIFVVKIENYFLNAGSDLVFLSS